MEKFKTIHENKVLINPPKEKTITAESMIQDIATHLGVTIEESLERIKIFSDELDKMKNMRLEAVEFAEWLRTFEVLYKMNGFWVLESQISSEELYNNYLQDRERWRNSAKKD